MLVTNNLAFFQAQAAVNSPIDLEINDQNDLVAIFAYENAPIDCRTLCRGCCGE